jgi:hypothetical protein
MTNSVMEQLRKYRNVLKPTVINLTKHELNPLKTLRDMPSDHKEFIKKINLSHNKLHRGATPYLIPILLTFPKLKLVDLSYNYLSFADQDEIIKALPYITFLFDGNT